MQVLEKEAVENPVVSYARDELGILVTKMNLKGFRGFPDDVFWIPGGRPLIIEFKAPGEEPDPRQRLVIKHLKKAKYDVHTCDDPKEGKRIVREAFEKATGTRVRSRARSVEAARVSKARDEVPSRARRGRLVSRSRPR